MSPSNRRNFFLLSMLCCVSITSAFAVDFSTPPGATTEVPTVNDNDDIRFQYSVGRSYCCTAWTRSAGEFVQFTAITDFSSTPFSESSFRGAASPVVSAQGISSTVAATRACFTGELIAGGSPLLLARFNMNANGAATSAANVTLKCEETSLIGGFNTSVTDFNFLELTNTLVANSNDDGVVTGRVVARNALNDTVVLDTTFEVQPGDRVDINLHASTGPGVFGPLVVTHDAPGGAIKGVVSQYRIVTPVPLDFEPVAQSVLTAAGE